MKYLKTFEYREKQIWEKDEALIVLSKIYNIKDVVNLGHRPSDLHDFLVEIDDFIKYADTYDGRFASNRFENISWFKHDISKHIEGRAISPVIYVAPFWFSRTENDLIEFRDVYSDTVYVQIITPNFSKEEIEEISNDLRADECNLIKSESGKIYLRIWWD